MTDWKILLGVPTAILAIIGIGSAVGTKIAWSIDIQRLDRKQAEQAVEIYRGKVRSLIVVPAPTDPSQKAIWENEVQNAIRERDAAERRSIELNK